MQNVGPLDVPPSQSLVVICHHETGEGRGRETFTGFNVKLYVLQHTGKKRNPAGGAAA